MSEPLHVLSVEPIEDDARSLKRCLMHLSGYRVSFSRLTHPAAALDRLGNLVADVVFIDYDLPNVTGLEVIATARAAGEQRAIIATAAQDCGYLAADLIRAGADGYLAKADCNPGFVGQLLAASMERAQVRALQVRLRREAVRELLRTRGRAPALV